MYKCLINIILFTGIISICTAIASIGKKSKKTYDTIIAVCCINTVFLFFYNVYAPNILLLDIGIEMLLIYLVSIIAGLIYIITSIVCGHKIKKYASEDIPDNKLFSAAAKMIVIVPILIFSFVFINELYLVRNSDLILVYTSNGPGFDSQTFAYAVNDHYCKEFDIGTDFRGWNIERFLPKDMIESYSRYQYINDHGKKSIQVNDYYIEIDTYETHSLVIYKNNELLHQTNYNSYYYNVDWESVYYRQ